MELADARGNVTGSWRINDAGTVRFKAPATHRRPAASPVLHLDASRTDLFEYEDGDSAKGIVKWNGVNGHGYAQHDGCLASDGTRALPTLQQNKQNGLPWVDFGSTYNKSSSLGIERAKAPYLVFQCGSGPDLNVYTVFIVEAAQNFVVGSNHEGADGYILHGNDSWTGAIATDRGETHTDFRYNADGVVTRLNGTNTTVLAANRRGQNKPDCMVFRAVTKPLRVGRLAWDRTYRTGCAQVCEVILYERKLTDEELYATEDYLREKWYGTPPEHAVERYDHVVDQLHFAATSGEVAVEEGTVVKANAVGGNQAGTLAGGGTLVSREYPNQQRPFTVENGTLALLPGDRDLAASATTPIHDTYCHFDAADTASFTLGEQGEVLEWRDENYATTGRAAYSPNDGDNPPPFRVKSALNGLPGVDSRQAGSGRCLLFNHTNTTIQAIFLVYADPAGNGMEFLHGDTYRDNSAHFHRGQNGEMFYGSGYVAGGIMSGSVWANGEKVTNPAGHYLAPGKPVVVGINLVSNSYATAAALFVDRWNHPTNGKKFRSGAQVLCEAVYYDRYLQADEFSAVQDWLMKKWMPRTPSAYHLAAGEEAYGELTSTANGTTATAALTAEAGESLTTGPLMGDSWKKTGAGTVTANGLDLTGTLDVADGTFALGERTLPTGYAPPPATFHVDAHQADTFTLDGSAVLSVCDADGGTRFAFAPTNNSAVLAPTRIACEELGGKSVIDFGDFGQADGTYGTCLLWNVRDINVRTIFLVVNAARGFGMPIGTRAEADGTYFRRQNGADSWETLWDGNASGSLSGGRTRINGVDVPNSGSWEKGWQVVTVLANDRCFASAFAADMYDTNATVPSRLPRMGGVMIAEALVYDAPIEDAQRRDIEAYLMRKWLGTAPTGYAGGPAHVGSLKTSGGTLALPAGASLAVDRVEGTNAVRFASEAAITVGDATALDGRLDLAAGSLTLADRVRYDADTIPTNGLIARFDMSLTNSLVTVEENGTNFVTRWTDATGQHYATPDTPINRPWILKGDCNGLDVLCTGPFSKINDGTTAPQAATGWLTWDQGGDCQAKTVIEVIGVQEGGNFLVSCVHGSPTLHRGGITGKLYGDSILADGREEPGQSLYSTNAFFSINGEKVTSGTGFPSASYHSFAVRVDDTKSPGYVYIGTFGRDRTYRWGGQRVCEVIAYDRCLSDDEIARLEAYLQNKWFGLKYQNFTPGPLADVAVTADATLDLGGETRTVAALAGAGWVTNGNVIVTDRFAPEAGLTLSGTLTFKGPGTIVVPVDQFTAGTVSPRGRAAALAGDLAQWTLVDRNGNIVHRDQLSPHLVVVDGQLLLRLNRLGTILLLK